jgi:hypothetical protein
MLKKEKALTIICPKCGPVDEQSNVTSIEISSVYDGVSFWHHADCRTLWSRWTDEVIRGIEVATPGDLTSEDWNKLGILAREQRQEYMHYGE